jgi:hypothetical protein
LSGYELGHVGVHGELAKTDGRGQAVVSVEDVVVRAQAVQLDGWQQPTTPHGLQDSLEALVVVVSPSARVESFRRRDGDLAD